jgi:uncharacterized protein YbaP (TraB family)
MRSAAGLVFAFLIAAPAFAQDWATRDVCTVDEPRIHEEVFAPGSLADLEQAAELIPNALGKFWQIRAPSGAISHLWGTYHSADPLIVALPEEVETIIDSSRVVAVEIDFTHPDRQSYRDAQLMEGRFSEASDPFSFSPGDGTVAGLPPEISNWVRDRAIELGWTEDFDLIMSLPGIAEMLLSDPCEDFTQGILPIQDDYIQLLGRLGGARILSLETPDEMIADLGADDETARAMIATYAAYLQPADSNRERATSFALYLQGRLGVMAAWDRAYQQSVYGTRALEALERTDDYLLDARNRRFIDRLSNELADGDAFVAVGSAHIPGEDGLVALLRASGYTVTRIQLPGESP